MSFLNPVSEPVLRFSSTDASAPQINYNARTAGDIKAVLKACLVTGYGAKASAGWSIVNEVNHVAEFVSPSAAMSDYRLGVDDSTTTKTTWYYQYLDVRVNPTTNIPVKTINNINRTHTDNGWQLFVTARGILLVEMFQGTVANKLSCRLTYWGQTKSALIDNTGINICFFSVGHEAPLYGSILYGQAYIRLGAYTGYLFDSALPLSQAPAYRQNISVLDLTSSMYVYNSALLLGQLPPIMTVLITKPEDMFGVTAVTLDARPKLRVTGTYSNNTADVTYGYGRAYLIATDYWEY